jgi:hypothetical protein
MLVSKSGEKQRACILGSCLLYEKRGKRKEEAKDRNEKRGKDKGRREFRAGKRERGIGRITKCIKVS